MEKLLKTELGLKQVVSTRQSAGGCISSANIYNTEIGRIFVKENSKKEARIMFEGEHAGLEKIMETDTIRVPKPIKVISNHPHYYIVTEYLDMTSSHKYAGELGKQLALLHKHNEDKAKGTDKYVSKFGFHVPTCCGIIPQNNEWCDDWSKFFIENRLQVQIDLVEANYHDKDAMNLWPAVKSKIPKLFQFDIKPSLLHGDLWSGNASATSNGPCVYDCAAFYGHSEYDLGIAYLFGGFSEKFHEEYHKLIPKTEGFDERNKLYQLFHYLNHWNHFGSGYKGPSISIMKQMSLL